MKDKKFYITMCIMIMILSIFSFFCLCLLLACCIRNFYSIPFIILVGDCNIGFMLCGYCAGIYDMLNRRSKK